MNLNTDDSWADLADELGIDTPATKAREQTQPPLPEPTPAPTLAFAAEVFEDLPDATESESDTSLEPGLASEPTSEGEAERKKKRRRRRRRGKGEGEAEGETEAGVVAVLEEGEGESEEDVEADALPPEFGSEPVPGEPMASAEPNKDDHEIMDEPTADAVRELISTWNVPSWQQLVSGLYRPGER